ncbi:hypothetical protein AYL99_11708 [Fonsecaea erecta]|uniref:Uncharacterized protein n=1 Tax=Fonsecaea erecta TaxID=1367422 RepID=A0A178Z4Q8_9EURO|nr:hypothetical protein AYL99_11708 [Fonsecaea erecta]OAP54173.1 hypothetical protein AYL99_11708 [Fonsecaea erecta]
MAARFGHEEGARLLLKGTDEQRANVELPEKAYRWTPLFIACVDRHLPGVELLINHEAGAQRLDLSVWNAKEHAVLRGHIHIAQKLDSVMPQPDTPIQMSPWPQHLPHYSHC